MNTNALKALASSVMNRKLPLALAVQEALGREDLHLAFDCESIFRETTSGTWFWYEGLDEERLNFWGPRGTKNRQFPTGDWFRLLRRAQETPDTQPHRLWYPGPWLQQGLFQERLGSVVTDILRAICVEGKSIREVPPRQLEELVAELLRARGLEISLTPFSKDGGRDIIARGELLPGEPMLLAVEVKQKPVVGIADVQRALRANEDFPALLVATAGRFSAGVVREKARVRNEDRLFLKDGIALSQWIAAYGQKRGWAKQRFRDTAV